MRSARIEPRRGFTLIELLVVIAIITIKRLAEGFAGERQQLEQQWSRGDEVSTEDLRIALQRYRSFFGRLLSL